MLEMNLSQILVTTGISLPIFLLGSISNKIKKTLFFASSVFLVLGLGISLPWAVTVLTLSLYASVVGMKDYFNNYILILIVCFGNWSVPGITEVFLVLLSVVMHIKFVGSAAKFIFPVFTITLMFYLLNASSIVVIPAITFSLLICISLLFLSFSTQMLKIVDIFTFYSTSLFIILLKTIVEQNISQLNISMYNTWYSFNLFILFYVLIRILIKHKDDKDYKNSFLKVLVLSFYLPTFVSLTPVSASEASSYAIMLLVGGTLYLKQKNQTLIDSIISTTLGVIIICVQVYFMIGLDLQGPVLLAMAISLSSQFFYLIKSIEYKSTSIGALLYRERLPQLAYISIVFGWICTLWYILYYVRKIQG